MSHTLSLPYMYMCIIYLGINSLFSFRIIWNMTALVSDHRITNIHHLKTRNSIIHHRIYHMWEFTVPLAVKLLKIYKFVVQFFQCRILGKFVIIIVQASISNVKELLHMLFQLHILFIILYKSLMAFVAGRSSCD